MDFSSQGTRMGLAWAGALLMLLLRLGHGIRMMAGIAGRYEILVWFVAICCLFAVVSKVRSKAAVGVICVVLGALWTQASLYLVGAVSRLI